MNLSRLKETGLKEVIDALEEAFNAAGTDYYIIGAVARDIWYSQANKDARQTKDIDFAVLIGNQTDYAAVKEYLQNHKNFFALKDNSFAMLTPSGIQIDILPFGELAINDGVTIEGVGLTNIKVNGFMEVYQSGTESIYTETGQSFKIATLPAIVLLKLIAYDDRPEKRVKDARDIADIILHYFDLQADFIYENHADLFLREDDPSLEEITAFGIGREIKKICIANDTLCQRVREILQTHIGQPEGSAFLRNMSAETGWTEEKNITLLQRMLLSIAGN